MIINTDDGEKAIECCVCGSTTDLEGTWEAITSNDCLDDDDDDDPGWYLHVHDWQDPVPTIDTDDTYGFCPDHLPKRPFPTADQNPTFDPEIEIERLKEKYND